MVRHFSMLIILFTSIASGCTPASPFPQDLTKKYLERIPELEHRAGATVGGALGCGIAKFVLQTDNGPVKVTCGLDPTNTFGYHPHFNGNLV